MVAAYMMNVYDKYGIRAGLSGKEKRLLRLMGAFQGNGLRSMKSLERIFGIHAV